MQYWDKMLYPEFLSFIRGEVYGIISRDDIDEQCYNLAVRAVAAFKFPRISTEYITFHAIRDEDGNLVEVTEEDPNYKDSIPHGYFTHDLTVAEIDILIAWMKVYWCEYQISNADNFEDIYTDANIKTYSRANAVDKNLKLMAEFKKYAQDAENRYGRVSVEHKPTIGDINDD